MFVSVHPEKQNRKKTNPELFYCLENYQHRTDFMKRDYKLFFLKDTICWLILDAYS